MALSNLKERCSKQQKKLDEMEREKLVLHMENEQMAKTLHRLDGDNMELRERNLQVSHELKQSHYEIIELRRHLDEQPMAMSMLDEDVDHDAAVLDDIQKVNQSMSLLKQNLLEQQNFVKRLIIESQSSQDGGTTPNNSPIPSSLGLTASPASSMLEKVCPMCEAVFNATTINHEDFVTHVNSHFSFEESDTLQNYEFVDENDASMS